MPQMAMQVSRSLQSERGEQLFQQSDCNLYAVTCCQLAGLLVRLALGLLAEKLGSKFRSTCLTDFCGFPSPVLPSGASQLSALWDSAAFAPSAAFAMQTLLSQSHSRFAYKQRVEFSGRVRKTSRTFHPKYMVQRKPAAPMT